RLALAEHDGRVAARRDPGRLGHLSAAHALAPQRAGKQALPWERVQKSLPRRKPLSTITVISAPTAARTAARVSMGAGALSSWRPPWLLTTTPSAPASCARTASSGSSTPLTSSLRGHRLRAVSFIGAR